MTNEELARRYYEGDEQVLELLYEQNRGFIISIAEDAAKDFNCLQWSGDPKEKYSSYTQPIIEDLCAEGTAEFISRIQRREYEEERGKLTTYLYPHLKGVMWRWLEQNLGNIALSKDDMAEVRQVQRRYHELWDSEEDIASDLGISNAEVQAAVGYNTHFFSVYDLPRAGDDDSDTLIYERLQPDRLSDAADGIAYRNICLELLHEMFIDLPEKDRSILGRSAGIFGYKKQKLQEIALEEILTEDGVIKARKAAIQRIKDSYPGSKLELWRKVYWLVKNTH